MYTYIHIHTVHSNELKNVPTFRKRLIEGKNFFEVSGHYFHRQEPRYLDWAKRWSSANICVYATHTHIVHTCRHTLHLTWLIVSDSLSGPSSLAHLAKVTRKFWWVLQFCRCIISSGHTCRLWQNFQRNFWVKQSVISNVKMWLFDTFIFLSIFFLVFLSFFSWNNLIASNHLFIIKLDLLTF